MNLTAVQSTVRDIIANDPFFAGELVLADDGRINDTLERQLASRGFAVVVGPVLSVDRVQGAQGTQLVRATLLVEVWENPEQNPSQGDIDSLGAVVHAIAAVTEYRPGPGDSRFDVGSVPVEIIANESDRRGYIVTFSKSAQLS